MHNTWASIIKCNKKLQDQWQSGILLKEGFYVLSSTIFEIRAYLWIIVY